jgi:8-oxo-dGTP pyrophosphatase MutT (NUDIX family)
MTRETPTLRRAARVLLLDEDRRVLLVRLAYRSKRWWAAPGGGLKDDETHETAARREIAEETGYELDELGPWVWWRKDVFRFEGRHYRQRERYFIASVPAFEPRPKFIDVEEAKTFDGLRWWTLGEIRNHRRTVRPRQSARVGQGASRGRTSGAPGPSWRIAYPSRISVIPPRSSQ